MRPFERRKNSVPAVLAFGMRSAVAGVLLVLFVLSARGAWAMYGRFSDASEEAEAARSELAELKERKADMQAAASGLATPRGIEAEVRERYGVARPGEGKIEIVHSSPEEELLGTPQKGSVVTRFFRALFVW